MCHALKLFSLGPIMLLCDVIALSVIIDLSLWMYRSLKTLLLEGNPVSELPPELGAMSVFFISSFLKSQLQNFASELHAINNYIFVKNGFPLRPYLCCTAAVMYILILLIRKLQHERLFSYLLLINRDKRVFEILSELVQTINSCPLFSRKCDYPQRLEPERLPHPFSPARYRAPGAPGHPAVPEERSRSTTGYCKKGFSRWMKGTLTLNSSAVHTHVLPHHLLFLSKTERLVAKIAPRPFTTSLAWLLFPWRQLVTLSWLSLSLFFSFFFSPTLCFSFQLWHIFSQIKMIDKLWALNSSSVAEQCLEVIIVRSPRQPSSGEAAAAQWAETPQSNDSPPCSKGY